MTVDLEKVTSSAQGLAAAGNFAEAARVLDDGLRFHPLAVAERYLLGVAKIAANDHRGGQKEIERCLILAPQVALHWRQLGNFHLRLGRREETSLLWWRAHGCAPNDNDLLYDMWTLIQKPSGLSDATRHAFRLRFSTFAASNWGIFRTLAQQADLNQRYTLSEQCLKQAIVADPEDSDQYLNMYFMSKYRYSAGIQCSLLRRGLCTLNPEQNLSRLVRLLGFYAIAQRQLGDTRPMIEDLRKALSLPSLTEHQRSELTRELVSCQIEAGDLSGSLANLQSLGSPRPRRPTTYLLEDWAGYYYEANDRENYNRLNNVDFIKCYDLKEIDPELDIRKFNSILRDRVQNHPSLKLLYRGDRGGYSQTKDRGPGSLLEDQAPELVRLRHYFERVLERYCAELPEDGNHAFLKLKDEPLRLSICWGLVIKDCKSSPTHRHGDETFATAIYYPNEKVDRGDPSDLHAGWLEAFRLDLNIDMAPADIRKFEPRPGHFIILPSYFHHRALPITSTKTRVSIVADFNFIHD
jgi:tetratricopeptide (TPR) repeat protein